MCDDRNHYNERDAPNDRNGNVIVVHIGRMKGVTFVTPPPTKVIMKSSFVGKLI